MDLYAMLAYIIGTFVMIIYVMLTRKEGKLQAQMIWAKIRHKALMKVFFYGANKTVKTHYVFPVSGTNTIDIDDVGYAMNPDNITQDVDRNIQSCTIVDGGLGMVNPLGTKTIKTDCPWCEKELEVDVSTMETRVNPQWFSLALKKAQSIGREQLEIEQKRQTQLLYICTGAAIGALVFAFITMNNQSAVIAAISRLEGVIAALGSGVVI